VSQTIQAKEPSLMLRYVQAEQDQPMLNAEEIIMMKKYGEIQITSARDLFLF